MGKGGPLVFKSEYCRTDFYILNFVSSNKSDQHRGALSFNTGILQHHGCGVSG